MKEAEHDRLSASHSARPSKAIGVSRPVNWRNVALPGQGSHRPRRRRPAVRRRDQPNHRAGFPRHADDVLGRADSISGDTPPLRRPRRPSRAARPRTPPAGRGRPRDHLAAATLGMAQRPARRRLGRAAQARRSGPARLATTRSRTRQSQEAAYRFMVAMAGDRPGFEEATRALFAGQGDRFDQETASWPADMRDHVRGLAAPHCGDDGRVKLSRNRDPR